LNSLIAHDDPAVHPDLEVGIEGADHEIAAGFIEQRFVALWKSADPELQPRVAQVRRRVASLQAGNMR
jgi:hypothetical protein